MKVFFIYPRAHKNTGSSKMRCFQLTKILNCYSRDNCEFLVAPISTLPIKQFWLAWIYKFPPGSVLIFCKNAIDRLPVQYRHVFKERGLVLGVDYVDRDMTSFNFSEISLHISSSMRQNRFLKSILKEKTKIIHLEHFADVAAYELPRRKIDQHNGRIFYLGEPNNVYLPSRFIGQVDILQYDYKIPIDLKGMSRYKFQYCIREPQQNRNLHTFKPSTKIMNSVALRVPAIISHDMEDAIELLGVNYPYILDGYDNTSWTSLTDKLSCQKSYRDAIKNLDQAYESFSLEIVCSEFIKEIQSSRQL